MLKVILFTDKNYLNPETQASISRAITRLETEFSLASTDKDYLNPEDLMAMIDTIARLEEKSSLTTDEKLALDFLKSDPLASNIFKLNLLKEALQIGKIPETTEEAKPSLSIDLIGNPFNPTKRDIITTTIAAAASGYKIHLVQYEEPQEAAIQPSSAKKMKTEEKEKD